MIFDAATLASLRKTQEDHMQDVCMIYRLESRTKNSRGEAVKSFDKGTESICGVNLSPEASNSSGSYTMSQINVILRLPHGTEVKPGDEIEITKRYGEAITAQRYEVDRFTDVGPSGGRAYLKVRTIA